MDLPEPERVADAARRTDQGLGGQGVADGLAKQWEGMEMQAPEWLEGGYVSTFSGSLSRALAGSSGCPSLALDCLALERGETPASTESQGLVLAPSLAAVCRPDPLSFLGPSSQTPPALDRPLNDALCPPFACRLPFAPSFLPASYLLL
jgi:hypothetical protein